MTSCPQQYALSNLRPHLQVTEPLVLEEAAEEVHQPKIRQQISDLLTAIVLVLANVGIEVS